MGAGPDAGPCGTGPRRGGPKAPGKPPDTLSCTWRSPGQRCGSRPAHDERTLGRGHAPGGVVSRGHRDPQPARGEPNVSVPTPRVNAWKQMESRNDITSYQRFGGTHPMAPRTPPPEPKR
ncbi:hypothetical protein GCM10009715_20590 [Paeniglutamicibacter psychrophenolicus]